MERIKKTRGFKKFYGEENLEARFQRVKLMLDADLVERESEEIFVRRLGLGSA